VEIRVLDVSGTAKIVRVGGGDGATVNGLMDAVARHLDVPLDRQRLICMGRIMKRGELLSAYGQIRTVHLFPLAAGAVARTDAQRAAANRVEEMSPALRQAPDFDMSLLDARFADAVREAQFANADQELGHAQTFEHDAYDSELGTPRDFFLGFVMGFVLGFIMLIYLWERSVPHKQKLGILAGASAQLLVKYMHGGAAAEALRF